MNIVVLYGNLYYGVKQMNNNLQKLKEKLDALLVDFSLNSQEALRLSMEIDRLIVEYYREKKQLKQYS